MQAIIFYIFAVAAVVGAFIVVAHKNPVGSVLGLVLTLFSTAVLFVLLYAHFIAVVQILVYAGAVIVLFLFAVMFLNLREEGLRFDTQRMPLKLGILFLVVLISGLLATIGFEKAPVLSKPSNFNPETFGTVEGVGELLFQRYLLPFELTSVLIVAAILGVVAIAKRRLD